MKKELVTKNKTDHLAILGALYALGFRYHKNVATPQEAAVMLPFEMCPILVVDIEGRWISGNSALRYQSTNMEEIIAEIAAQRIEVKLNDEYTAVVHRNKVVVGCQEFSFEKVDELAAAVARQREHATKA